MSALYALANKGALELHEIGTWNEVERWFVENLPVPEIDVDRAIHWFKPEADEFIKRMHELVALLRHHDVSTTILYTRDPGTILYEDEFQIAAVPPKKSRKRRR